MVVEKVVKTILYIATGVALGLEMGYVLVANKRGNDLYKAQKAYLARENAYLDKLEKEQGHSEEAEEKEVQGAA